MPALATTNSVVGSDDRAHWETVLNLLRGIPGIPMPVNPTQLMRGSLPRPVN